MERSYTCFALTYQSGNWPIMATFTRRDALRASAIASVASVVQAAPALPTVPFGPHSVSRLIVGGNPISGNSHVSSKLSTEMRDYFTGVNIKKLLFACERAGINTWQSRGDRHIMRLLNEYRAEGGRMQWIAMTASEYGDLRVNLREISAMRPIAIYHHGTVTDEYWNGGKIDQVSERLKAIRQTGAQVGLGTHVPEVIDYVESKGWDLDFYMTCVYNISRTPEEAAKVAGHRVEGEFFWDADREKMLSRVRRVSKTCLIFKVYGATRQCASAASRQAAIDLAFQYAEPAGSRGDRDVPQVWRAGKRELPAGKRGDGAPRLVKAASLNAAAPWCESL